MPAAVRVRTGARLHFGLLAVQAEVGRDFGGTGVMIDSPGCELLVRLSDRDEVLASAGMRSRFSAWRDRVRETLDPQVAERPIQIESLCELPSHSGLGSGTQSALALAVAMNWLLQERRLTSVELATQVGRGSRSAIGVHGFDRGGFLLEAGKRATKEISPLVARLSFPTEWRLLLAFPIRAHGLSGDAERQAFAKLGAMPRSTTERLCRIALMDLLPAIAESDFETASASLFEFGRINGEYFTPVQGGQFADPRSAQLANWLQDAGCHGVGQTSWGPSLFALIRNDGEANQLKQAIAASPLGQEFEVLITQARNQGAAIANSVVPSLAEAELARA